MFNFFKRNKKKKTASTNSVTPPPISDFRRPSWLDYMNDKQYAVFMKEVHDYFKNLGLSFKMDDGVIKVEENDLGLNNLGISNISQTCARSNTSEYKFHITEHFNQMQKIHQFNQKFDKIKNEWSLVSQYIGIRLIRSESIGAIGEEHMITQSITADTSNMIIYDLPESTSNIKPAMLEKWGKSLDEVYEMAYKNCEYNYPFDAKEHMLDGVKVQVYSADHFFSPMVIQYPDIMQKHTSDYGALVIFPTRHLCMIHKIENLNVVQAVNKMIAVAQGSFRDGPGSLSHRLYWYLPNQLTELPYKLGEKLEFSPPKKFVDMMNLLEPAELAEPTAPRILPRIKANYSHEIYKNDDGPFLGTPLSSDIEIPQKFLPIITDATADLTMMFAIDTGDQYTVIQNEFFEKNPEYTIEKLKEEALKNVVIEINEKIKVSGDISDKCMLTCGGNFEAALLFLDLWGQIHDGMGNEIYVVLPTRDVLLAAKITEENKTILKDAVKGYFNENAEFLTSKAVYVKRRGSSELEIVDVAF